jgi:hypothetical protein
MGSVTSNLGLAMDPHSCLWREPEGDDQPAAWLAE